MLPTMSAGQLSVFLSHLFLGGRRVVAAFPIDSIWDFQICIKHLVGLTGSS